jgi:hypothetical protein
MPEVFACRVFGEYADLIPKLLAEGLKLYEIAMAAAC